jgi:hypothetical protein
MPSGLLKERAAADGSLTERVFRKANAVGRSARDPMCHIERAWVIPNVGENRIALRE